MPVNSNTLSARRSTIVAAHDTNGLYGLVDIASYPSFHGTHSSPGAIRTHVAENAGSIALWSFGEEANLPCRVLVVVGGEVPAGIRRAGSAIRSTTGTLHVVSYRALTSTARSPLTSLPVEGEQSWAFDVAPGIYRVTLVQRSDAASPDSYARSLVDVVLHLVPADALALAGASDAIAWG